MRPIHVSFILRPIFVKKHPEFFYKTIPILNKLKEFFCSILRQGECLITFSLNKTEDNKWLVEILLNSSDITKYDFLALEDVESLKSEFITLVQPPVEIDRFLNNEILKNIVVEENRLATLIHQYDSGRVKLEITPYVKGKNLLLYIYSTLTKLKFNILDKFRFDLLMQLSRNLNYTLNISVEDLQTGIMLYPDKAYGDFALNQTQKVTTQTQMGVTPSLGVPIGVGLNLNHQILKEQDKNAYTVVRKESKNNFSFQHTINDLSETGNIYTFDHLLLFISDEDLDISKLRVYIEIDINNRKKSFYISELLKFNTNPGISNCACIGPPKSGKTTFIKQIFNLTHKLGPSLETTTHLEKYVFDHISIPDIEPKSFNLIDTMGYYFNQETDKTLLSHLIFGLKDGSTLSHKNNNYILDTNNALTHIILVFNARDLLIESDKPIFLKYDINLDKLLSLYQNVKDQFAIKYDNPEDHILILITHNDMIPNIRTDQGQTRLIFQNLVESKLSQIGISTQTHVFMTETTCEWSDDIVSNFENEINTKLKIQNQNQNQNHGHSM